MMGEEASARSLHKGPSLQQFSLLFYFPLKTAVTTVGTLWDPLSNAVMQLFWSQVCLFTPRAWYARQFNHKHHMRTHLPRLRQIGRSTEQERRLLFLIYFCYWLLLSLFYRPGQYYTILFILELSLCTLQSIYHLVHKLEAPRDGLLWGPTSDLDCAR